MVSASPVMLTGDGIEQLANELAGFRERRATLAGALATSPDDLGEIQGELFQADRRIAEIQGVLARAQPIDDVVRIPGVVGLGARVTVRWDASPTSLRSVTRSWIGERGIGWLWKPSSEQRGSRCSPSARSIAYGEGRGDGR